MSEGLSQLRKIAAMTEMRDRLFIPHHGNNGIGLAAHLQLCATIPNCPWVEFIIDPPYRTVETYQQLWGVIANPIMPDKAGNIEIPAKPGLGVELDEAKLARYRIGP
jgi:L-alanine-DL-glutamate epimerase-like enolase superfamily enzyme